MLMDCLMKCINSNIDGGEALICEKLYYIFSLYEEWRKGSYVVKWRDIEKNIDELEELMAVI